MQFKVNLRRVWPQSNRADFLYPIIEANTGLEAMEIGKRQFAEPGSTVSAHGAEPVASVAEAVDEPVKRRGRPPKSDRPEVSGG